MDRKVVTFEARGLSRKQRRQLQTLSWLLTAGPVVADDSVDALPSVPASMGGQRAGGTGGSYWSRSAVRQPEHQATSFTLAATYPFLSGPPLPAAGPVLGIDLRSGGEFAFDPWEWYKRGWVSSPNILIMGGYRQGKSFFVKMLVTRCILFGRQGINTSDPKGEHGRVAKAVGGDVIRLGAGGSAARLNPLDRGPRMATATDVEHEAHVAARRSSTLAAMVEMLLPRGKGLEVHEYSALEWALGREIIETDDRPTVGGIYRRFEAMTEGAPEDKVTGYYPELRDDSRRLGHALRRLVTGDLAGMFDGHSTVTLREDSPYTVFDTEEMMQRGSTALGLSQLVTNAWVNSVIADKTSGRKYFVLAEEGWAEMNSVASLKAMQLRQKLSGEFDICTIMVVHEGGDFKAVGRADSEERALAEGLVNGFANKVTFRQESGQLKATADIVGFSPEDVEDILSLDRGEALFKVKDRSFLLSTIAVSSDWERKLFNTDSTTGPREGSAAGAVLRSADGRVCPSCGTSGQRMKFCVLCGGRMPGKETAV